MVHAAAAKHRADTMMAYLKVGIRNKSTGKSGASCLEEWRHKIVPVIRAVHSKPTPSGVLLTAKSQPVIKEPKVIALKTALLKSKGLVMGSTCGKKRENTKESK